MALRVSSETKKKPDEEYGKYTQSADVTAAKNAAASAAASDPRNNSQFGAVSKQLLDQYLDRGEFSYDINTDALYRQYADAYARNGQRAMRDTMANAAALTGGFGNSYAGTAGQQAYQSYMDALNDKLPELYAQAYDRYLQAGNELLNKYNAANAADRQTLEDFFYEREYADNKYNAALNFDYNQWADDRDYRQKVAAQENADYWNQLDFDYQKERDAVEDARYDREWNYNVEQNALDRDYQARRDAVEDARYDREWNYNVGQNALDRAAAQAEASGEERAQEYDPISGSELSKYVEMLGNYGGNELYNQLNYLYENGSISYKEAQVILGQLGIPDSEEFFDARGYTYDELSKALGEDAVMTYSQFKRSDMSERWGSYELYLEALALGDPRAKTEK